MKGIYSPTVGQLVVFPAIDTRTSAITSSTSTTVYTWVNNDSIQILSSGLDMKYGD